MKVIILMIRWWSVIISGIRYWVRNFATRYTGVQFRSCTHCGYNSVRVMTRFTDPFVPCFRCNRHHYRLVGRCAVVANAFQTPTTPPKWIVDAQTRCLDTFPVVWRHRSSCRLMKTSQTCCFELNFSAKTTLAAGDFDFREDSSMTRLSHYSRSSSSILTAYRSSVCEILQQKIQKSLKCILGLRHRQQGLRFRTQN